MRAIIHFLAGLKRASAVYLCGALILLSVISPSLYVSAADSSDADVDTDIAVIENNVYGDADGNGRVDIFDVYTLKTQYAQGGQSDNKYTDLDGNGNLDIKDIKLLESYIINKVITFPARASETGENDLFYSEMLLDDDGELNIIRKAPDISMGEDDTWTIFVYMCGSNLESYQGAGSADIQEMLNVSAGNNVKFIVETGGSNSWKNKMISADFIQRFEISGGTMTKKAELPKAPMCESGTLSDFLKWGVQNYPAGKMGVVLWNHGGGCINGVCSDELYDNKLLKLTDIDKAFSELSAVMTDKFEFIGFDACIMAEIECANICSRYARYMYGSQELEPGNGWDYTALGNSLGADPYMDGSQLGVQLTDAYYQSCAAQGEEASSTFSCIDLSKIDELIIKFNSYAKNLYENSKEKKSLVRVIKRIREGGDFGSTTQSMSYTNMVDMLSVMFSDYDLNFGIGFDPVEAVGNTTVCVKNGSRKTSACGLSIYYPLAIYDVSELVDFAKITVSPYYLSFVDMVAFNQGKNNISSSYDNSKIMELWLRLQNGDNTAETELYDYWNGYSLNFDGTSALIQLKSEPQVIDDKFTFELTDETIENVDEIRAMVWAWSYDRRCLYEMGDTKEVIIDGNKVSDNFSALWPSLPDGQNLAIYVSSSGEGYTEYVSPVMINERGALLVFTVSSDETISLDGYCYDFNEAKMSSRLIKLEKGDIIVPAYYSEYVGIGYAFLSTGKEYVYDGQTQLLMRSLEDGMYSFGFAIYDIFGLSYSTDYTTFTLKGDKIKWGFNMSRNIISRAALSDVREHKR